MLENDLSCFFLENGVNLLALVAILSLLKLLFMKLSKDKPMPANEGEKPHWTHVINNGLNLNFFGALFSALHLDMLMASFSNLRSFGFNSHTLAWNSLASLVVASFYLYLIAKMMTQSILLTKIMKFLKENENYSEAKSHAELP